MPAPRPPPPAPLDDRDRDRLQRLLDAVPAPLEPLDLSALDGYLVGVVLQPKTPARWLEHVHDLDGRPAPPGHDLAPLHALVRRRHAELEHAIAARRWFDPWVFELEPGPDGQEASPSETVRPWAAGFAAAQDLFPELMLRADSDEGREALALIYAHFEPEDLEDADDLLAVIDTLEPCADLAEAVESLVRASLLLADLTRPCIPANTPRGPGRTLPSQLRRSAPRRTR